jgi:hypothetical protein
MFYFPYIDEDTTAEQRVKIKEKEWTDWAVRRFIARVGEENLEDLFALRIADASSNPMTAFKPEEILQLQLKIADVRSKDMALKISDLRISGEDLIALGVPKGPKIGEILKKLLDMVIEDPMVNSKEKLTEISSELIK